MHALSSLILSLFITSSNSRCFPPTAPKYFCCVCVCVQSWVNVHKTYVVYRIICIAINDILSASNIAGCVVVDSVGDKTNTTYNNIIFSLSPNGVSFIFFLFVFVCVLRVERLLMAWWWLDVCVMSLGSMDPNDCFAWRWDIVQARIWSRNCWLVLCVACRVCVCLHINLTNYNNKIKQIINCCVIKATSWYKQSNYFILRQSRCLLIFNPHSPIHCMSICDNAFSYPTLFSSFF